MEYNCFKNMQCKLSIFISKDQRGGSLVFKFISNEFKY